MKKSKRIFQLLFSERFHYEFVKQTNVYVVREYWQFAATSSLLALNREA